MPFSKQKDYYERVYSEMREEGENTVDDVLQWLKDTKLIEAADKTEDEVRKMLREISIRGRVGRDQFLAMVEKLIHEQQIHHDAIQAKLERERQRIMETAEAARRAYENAKRHSSCEIM